MDDMTTSEYRNLRFSDTLIFYVSVMKGENKYPSSEVFLLKPRP